MAQNLLTARPCFGGAASPLCPEALLALGPAVNPGFILEGVWNVD